MKGPQEPGFLHSLLSFGGVVVTVIVGLLWFGISLHSLLIVALIWVAGNAAALGVPYPSIKTAMTAGIEKGLGAIYIFILIGVLVAALIEGGTIGSLIYYGIDLLHPAIFLPTGLLLCTLMSLATGTAWGTIATIGVVLVGLGGALGIPLPIVAGMVVSGASFGDKMSPVSDTTILAAMSAETDIYAHIRSMLYTSAPTYVICLVAFSLVGIQYAGQTLSAEELLELQGRPLKCIRYQPTGAATAVCTACPEHQASSSRTQHARKRRNSRGSCHGNAGPDDRRGAEQSPGWLCREHRSRAA